MTMYGYARVSTTSQNLGDQKQQLKNFGVENKNIYAEKITGTTTDRPVFNQLLAILKEDDMLVITKLDRLARNTREALDVVDNLLTAGVTIEVLNLGRISNDTSGKLVYTILLAVAEMERDMIVSRTQEGKKFAKKYNKNYKEGRPKRKLTKQYLHALEVLKHNTYKETAELTNLSISTLQRIKKQYDEEQENEKV